MAILFLWHAFVACFCGNSYIFHAITFISLPIEDFYNKNQKSPFWYFKFWQQFGNIWKQYFQLTSYKTIFRNLLMMIQANNVFFMLCLIHYSVILTYCGTLWVTVTGQSRQQMCIDWQGIHWTKWTDPAWQILLT